MNAGNFAKHAVIWPCNALPFVFVVDFRAAKIDEVTYLEKCVPFKVPSNFNCLGLPLNRGEVRQIDRESMGLGDD